MFNPADDPLGLALKGRAREHQINARLHGGTSPIGPLVDPNWDAYAQAISEVAGPKKGVRFGYYDQPAPDLTRDPDAMAASAANFPMQPGGIQKSQQLGTPIDLPPSIRSLKRAGAR